MICADYSKINMLTNKFGKTINMKYPRLEKDIYSIISGRLVTTHIDNPFLLLREILREYYDGERIEKLSENATLAFLFSCWNASRGYKR